MMWIIPAKVGGTWKTPQGQLTLKQQYQMVTGTFATGGTTSEITNGRLRGDQITFTAGGTQYTGRVNGNSIDGTTSGRGASGKWSAARAAAGD
jgi:hypothetical protein